MNYLIRLSPKLYHRSFDNSDDQIKSQSLPEKIKLQETLFSFIHYFFFWHTHTQIFVLSIVYQPYLKSERENNPEKWIIYACQWMFEFKQFLPIYRYRNSHFILYYAKKKRLKYLKMIGKISKFSKQHKKNKKLKPVVFKYLFRIFLLNKSTIAEFIT